MNQTIKEFENLIETFLLELQAIPAKIINEKLIVHKWSKKTLKG